MCWGVASRLKGACFGQSSIRSQMRSQKHTHRPTTAHIYVCPGASHLAPVEGCLLEQWLSCAPLPLGLLFLLLLPLLSRLGLQPLQSKTSHNDNSSQESRQLKSKRYTCAVLLLTQHCVKHCVIQGPPKRQPKCQGLPATTLVLPSCTAPWHSVFDCCQPPLLLHCCHRPPAVSAEPPLLPPLLLHWLLLPASWLCQMGLGEGVQLRRPCHPICRSTAQHSTAHHSTPQQHPCDTV
jgi:hypothetical protein